MSDSKQPRRRLPVAQMNIVIMTFVVYYLFFAIQFNDGSLIPWPSASWGPFFDAIVPSVAAFAVYLAWFLFQVLLERLLPARSVQGTPLPDGSRLSYRINGLRAMVVTLVSVAVGYKLDLLPLAWLHTNFGALLTSITIFSFLLAYFVMWWGARNPGGPGKTTGSFFRDYFYGTALNPRTPAVSGFDWKFFCECRPGLIGWLVLDLGMAAAQFEKYGEVSLAMWAVIFLQTAYVANNFWNEAWLLGTIDIQQERFGWMLVFGDLVLVPMTYCLQAYWLVDHFRDPSPIYIAAVILLAVAGYTIFMGTNLQKDRFRADPDNCKIWGKPARYLDTERGTKLLLSGYWGMARHMNYLGDWMVALSFGLCAGFGSIVPYFYPIWFPLLLITRERRDDRWCAKKYGKDWDRYKKEVPYRIIPGLY